jgi:hypothetical protein
MTIVEFLFPLKKGPSKDLCLAALYFGLRYNKKEAFTVKELRSFLKRARIPRADRLNLADVLAKAAPYVESIGRMGKYILWQITSTGQQHVRSILGLPDVDVEIEHDVTTLEKLLTTIPDKAVVDYIQEAIKCLSIDALRAAIVFLWTGAIRRIQEQIMTYNISDINSSFLRHDPKARTIKRIDDLSYFKESTLLLAAQDLGIFDKNERGILEEALDLRNKCGHPGKYRPGPKKISSFIEDVVGIVFT